MPIPEQDNPSCPTTNTSGTPDYDPNTFNPPFNLNGDDLDQNHEKNGYIDDPVSMSGQNGASPPISPSYTIADIPGIDDPFLEQTYSIDIHWIDPHAEIQGIEISREGRKFKKVPPTLPTTTKGWFVTDPTLGVLNTIATNLEWGRDYTFKLRTSYQFVGSGSIFSEWVYLSVFQRNEDLRRKNDKCAIETLESMEVRLSQNFAAIPKAYQYSKIVKGGSRKVICKTWRPQGWSNGSFSKEDYPITMKVEEEQAQKAIIQAGQALCGENPCISGDTGSELTKFSSYTGGLIFGTAALNFKEGMKTTSAQIYPCGKGMRRTGGKLPIN